MDNKPIRVNGADYRLRWTACVPLTATGHFFSVTDAALKAVPLNGTGVYLFCRRQGAQLIPQYIGRSKRVRQRIREHLERVSLVRARRRHRQTLCAGGDGANLPRSIRRACRARGGALPHPPLPRSRLSTGQRTRHAHRNPHRALGRHERLQQAHSQGDEAVARSGIRRFAFREDDRDADHARSSAGWASVSA